MKLIHIESGLGNQMLSYCEFLSMRKANPNDDIYVETIIFDIPECNEVTCQWNGYELEKVFGINSPNISTIVSDSNWENLMNEIRDSHFWEKNMNYPVYFTKAFKNIGIDLVNTWGDFEQPQFMQEHNEKKSKGSLKYRIHHSVPYMHLRMWKMRKPKTIVDCSNELFPSSSDNLFAGQKLKFKNKGSGIELIENEIRQSFTFPALKGQKNIDAMDYIRACNSVAIHARRGDMLGSNYACYATGYFKRAVKYIRRHSHNPKFFIFCDPGSIQWAKENENVLGLDFSKDEIHFVDWNKSTDSYIDMQLMAECKHQIITNSSFGWWGAWLNTNPDKITISPDYRINTTHTL
ncbi:alpha-1,2-fucosyltransferase [uncultured Phocaeicola sp.]|uniref:alpha-1,2-fucosyltransferase n=1 Tax=uncultured Phocaeicola sp. TaxID=990718 RepID=UPI00258749B5|nr:alpha-1,2-fucosyltransferase [uncultured Phocaeicola sp.]